MHSFGFEHALQFEMIKWMHFNQAPVNFCMMFYCLCRCVKTVYLILRLQRRNTIFNSHVFCLFIYSVSQHTWTAVFLFFFCSHAHICICSSVWFDSRILKIGIHHLMKGVKNWRWTDSRWTIALLNLKVGIGPIVATAFGINTREQMREIRLF